MNRKYYRDGARPIKKPNTIWVFGSNMAGIHGAGAAFVAHRDYGRPYGTGFGIYIDQETNLKSYAIPTKDIFIKTLPLDVIWTHVDSFLLIAKLNDTITFHVTRIGCGLAGYDNSEIAPMFKDASENCHFSHLWKEYLEI